MKVRIKTVKVAKGAKLTIYIGLRPKARAGKYFDEKIKSLDITIPVEDWDAEKERVKDTNRNFFIYNETIGPTYNRCVKAAALDPWIMHDEVFEKHFYSDDNTRDLSHKAKSNESYYEFVRKKHYKSTATKTQALRNLTKISLYTAKDDLAFSEVTKGFISKYESWLKDQPAEGKKTKLKESSVWQHMSTLQRNMNDAVEAELITGKSNPFAFKKLSAPKYEDPQSLDLEAIRKYFTCEVKDEYEDWARDAWKFSFFTNGMRRRDLILLERSQYSRGKLYLVTSKDKENFPGIQLQQQALEIIKKYKKAFPEHKYLFPFIEVWNDLVLNRSNLQYGKPKKKRFHEETEDEQFKIVGYLGGRINQRNRKIAEREGISPYPSMHRARHSMANQMAIQVEEGNMTIQEAAVLLGHSDIKTSTIYMSRLQSMRSRKVNSVSTKFYDDLDI